MSRIFISYSRQEETIVHDIARALEQQDLAIWLDVQHIATGDNWRDAIQRGLDECSMMLLVITPNAMESEQVANEWHYYLDEGKPIIPILLEPARIHYQLRSLNYIDFHQQDFESAFEKLLEAIAEKSPQKVSAQETMLLDMLQSAYTNWLNFDRADDLLMDKRQTARILETMRHFNLSESHWRYLLASIAYCEQEVAADSSLVKSLQSLDSETLAMIIEPLLVYPNEKVRQNTVKLIGIAQLERCVDALEQCISQEANEETILLMINVLSDLEIDVSQELLKSTFDRCSQWHIRSQLLVHIQQENKNLLFISDGTDLAQDFQEMLTQIGFNIVEVTPTDLLMMPYILPKMEIDFFEPYHLIFIIKGEHFSTVNYQSFYDLLARYIHRGGALFATAWVAWESQSNATLASILPFTYQSFKENATLTCKPTELGQDEQLFTEDFTMLTSYEKLVTRPETQVLLEDSKREPIFGYRYIGEGRTFYLNSCQHSCAYPFEAQTRESPAFKNALARVFRWVYESV